VNILIVAENASAQLGGEAILPLHYYRYLKKRNIRVSLLVHERVRESLFDYFEDTKDIHYIRDTRMHKILWRLGQKMPKRIFDITLNQIMQFRTQIEQRKKIQEIIKNQNIQLIHQPIPVSPKTPSLIYGFKLPVIIGPMNGGMDFPPAFQYMKVRGENVFYKVGSFFSGLFNFLIPGKKKAALLLVANERTKKALPKSVKGNIQILVENGVDLNTWDYRQAKINNGTTHFTFMGRLVDWKTVDILLDAFKEASGEVPISLSILGDGVDYEKLVEQAKRLDIYSTEPYVPGRVYFHGWLSQDECSKILSESDCLVLPSVRECGGAVVLEAMAIGLPVISTKWGGPTDYLDENCGILVEPTSEVGLRKGFSEAMVLLHNNPEQRIQMGNAGRKKIEDNYDWEKKIDKIIEYYRGLIHI
jgi:glycosyltransferase involved in cell wall biosynthesis